MAPLVFRPTLLKDMLVTYESFGGNYLFNRSLMGGDIGPTGLFDESADALGIAHFRYPGGTVTERLLSLSNSNLYDTTDPNSPLGFLKWSDYFGAKTTIVLPTLPYLEAVATCDQHAMHAAEVEIKDFIRTLIRSSYGNCIDGFEIGNEFYGLVEYVDLAQNLNQTPAEIYGTVAAQLAIWIQQVIDAESTGNDPAIIVQAGQTSQENSEVLARFSQQAFAAIDGVTIHNYRWTPWTSESTTAEKFSFIEEWQKNVPSRYLLNVVSEWNVASPNGAQGLPGAAGLLELFHQMEMYGADRADIWPIVQNTKNALTFSQSTTGGSVDLTLQGEAFRMLSHSLPGLSPYKFNGRIDSDGDGTPDVLVQAYGDGSSKLVVMVSSLNGYQNHITLDLNSFGEIAARYLHLKGEVLGVSAGSDPLSPTAQPLIKFLDATTLEGILRGDGLVDLTLNPYEIASIAFSGKSGCKGPQSGHAAQSVVPPGVATTLSANIAVQEVLHFATSRPDAVDQSLPVFGADQNHNVVEVNRSDESFESRLVTSAYLDEAHQYHCLVQDIIEIDLMNSGDASAEPGAAPTLFIDDLEHAGQLMRGSADDFLFNGLHGESSPAVLHRFALDALDSLRVLSGSEPTQLHTLDSTQSIVRQGCPEAVESILGALTSYGSAVAPLSDFFWNH